MTLPRFFRFWNGAGLAACLAIVLALSLAGCGGGGSKMSMTGGDEMTPSDGQPEMTPSDGHAVIALTDAQPPTETVVDQTERELGILAATDSLLLSNVYGETVDPADRTLVAEAECFGSSCTVAFGGQSRSFGPRFFLGGLTGDGDAILTKNDITMLQDSEDDYRAYGAWLEHAAFGVETGVEPEVNLARYGVGVALGGLTGSKPTAGTATWRGLMVGTVHSGPARSNFLQGDATLTFDMTSSSIDAAFTDIKDLDRGAAHSTANIRFDDIPVSSDGTYETGTAGDRIRGAFYGPSHAETAGVFEHSRIVGAFGAKKQ